MLLLADTHGNLRTLEMQASRLDWEADRHEVVKVVLGKSEKSLSILWNSNKIRIQ